MKIFFVSSLLTSSIIGLFMMLDLLMGFKKNEIIWKAMNPFRVMEPSEYIVVIILLFFILVNSVTSFLNKRKKKKTPQG